MKKIFAFILLFPFFSPCFAQKDSIQFKSQKGFLFLSSYSYLYDKTESEVKSIGFSDYFFPTNSFNEKTFLDSTKQLNFKDGLRVEFFNERKQLKLKALKFNVSNNQCYFYDSIFIIPVIIDYTSFDDTWPIDCRSDFFDIKITKGSDLRFYHKRKAIVITQIIKNRSKE